MKKTTLEQTLYILLLTLALVPGVFFSCAPKKPTKVDLKPHKETAIQAAEGVISTTAAPSRLDAIPVASVTSTQNTPASIAKARDSLNTSTTRSLTAGLIDSVAHRSANVNTPSTPTVSLPKHSATADAPDSLSTTISATIQSMDSVPVESVERNVPTEEQRLILESPDSVRHATSLTPPPPPSEKPFVLQAPVDFSAQDSMIMTGNRQLYLFGASKVDYQKLSMEAHFMQFNADSSQLFARYVVDSLGHAAHLPKFSDGNQSFESRMMKYNFSTEQGFITGVTTRQGEAYLIATIAKRLKDNTMFLQNGRLTTCNHTHHPHFYINLTRAKALPNDRIVTGPAYLVIADVPIYLLGLPFGFFPFNEKRTSGVIMPQYGIDQTKGLYLRNGGFYFNFNDYYDLAVRGEFYANGSWGVNARTSYIKRYKYSGGIEVGFLSTAQGYKAIAGTYSRSNDLSINWHHQQDAKADPLRTFSASVNFATSSYNHNSVEEMYNNPVRAQNNKGSSISYTRRFVGLPLTLSGGLSIDQRSRDSTLSVTLPNLTISLSSVYPFKRKKRLGKEQWYERIAMSYTGTLRNSITTKEHLFFKSNLIRDWQNGMQHSIPISASFDLFNYIKVSPSFNYNARWYTRKVKQAYDAETKQFMPSDTTYGFYHLNEFSASLGVSTTLYGFFKPWKIFGGWVQMIRHRVTPSVTLSYSPDFSTPFWKIYESIPYSTDPALPDQLYVYSPFEREMFGTPGRGKNGTINFRLDNNLEMKVRNRVDSLSTQDLGMGDKNEAFRKISLIDQLGLGMSYNMAADSFKWSNLSANIAIRFTRSFVLRLNGQFDTYLYDYTLDPNGKPIVRRVNKLRIQNKKGFGRLIGTGTGISYTFNPESFRKAGAWFDKVFNRNKPKEGDADTPDRPGGDTAYPSRDRAPIRREKTRLPDGDFANGDHIEQPLEYDSYGYLQYNYPWSFSFNYSMNVGYDYNNFNIETKEYRYKWTQNLSFRGNFQPTANWNINFDANYNFDLKKVTNLNISLMRDMHCWQLTANVIPLGPYKSFNVTVAVKAQLLKDLKWHKASLPGSGRVWYDE